MTLLDFARGPGLQWSLYIMLFGVMWRIVGSVLLMARKDLSTPRKHSGPRDGVATILRRSLPTPAFEHRIRFQHISGYAWHLALFIAVLFFAPHIVFFESLLGFGWPHLPNTIILFAAAVATAVLIALLIRRMGHPVQRHISNADDYISILVVLVPLITGILAFAHVGGRYETLLAVHLLSVEVMFIWLPFGKLMHTFLTFPSRYQAGTYSGRKGVRA
jgi:nitrate reductase gamma subunit